MRSELWLRIQELFDAALDYPPEERAAFLGSACGSDSRLQAEVVSLLETYEEDPDFLEQPAGQAPETDQVPAGLRSEDSRPNAADQEGMEGQVLGRYRILRRLGEGGMAHVYLARRDDQQFEQEVALKLVKRGMDTGEIIRRFRSERQILASLDHPHIARLFDGGMTEDGRPYFIMEHIDGERIDDYCRRHRLPIRVRLDLFRSVCDAVHYAHQNLVVHRDLKPSNILVSTDGRVKLVDFGIAKLLDREIAEATTLLGNERRPMTPEYASPEQLRGDPVTTASDVYSLGILLYELLTGRRPHRFDSRFPPDMIRILESQEPPRPSTMSPSLRRSLRGDLDTIALTALQRDPRRRYPSAEALSEDVRRHIDGLPVVARGEGVWYLLGKFVWRHRIGVAVTACILLLVIGFATITAVQSARITHQAAQIARERDRAEQITGLLVDMFDVSDPYGAEAVQGDTLRVREFLRRNETRLIAELTDQPEIRADVVHLFGRLYGNLGLHEQAVELATRGLEIRRQLYAGVHPDIAESIDYLGTLEQFAGHYDSAVQLFEEALEMRRATLGNRHVDVAESLNNLGVVYGLKGDRQAALRFSREALQIRRAVHTGRHPAVAQSLNNLGMCLYLAGNLDEAEPLVTEALDIRREALGATHPHVANTLNNLGRIERDRGDLDAAAAHFEEALRIWRASLGEEHPQVSYGLFNLGLVTEQRGDLDRAISIFRQASAFDHKAFPEGHPYIADSSLELGRLLLKRGDAQGAAGYLREALDIYTERNGPSDPEALRSQTLLGVSLARSGRYADAEECLARTYAVLVDAGGGADDDTGCDAVDDAAVQEAAQTVENGGPPNSRDIARELVSLYDAWGKPEAAAPYRMVLEP